MEAMDIVISYDPPVSAVFGTLMEPKACLAAGIRAVFLPKAMKRGVVVLVVSVQN